MVPALPIAVSRGRAYIAHHRNDRTRASPDPRRHPMNGTAAPARSPRLLLSAMMFLEIFIWGAWFPPIFDYLPSLGFSATPETWWQTPLILGAFNLAAFVALFFSTQFVDRNFAAEKFMAFSHLVGGLAMLGLFWVRKEPGAASAPFWPFFGLMLLHTLFYVPTISISNSIAFANLKDPQAEFGPTRMWGTIGWIAAAWPFIFILTDWAKVPEFGSIPFTDWLGKALGTPKTGDDYRAATSYVFVAAGVASLLLAALSLALPHTPPKPAAGEKLAWLEALKLLRHPFLFVLFVVTFIDAAVHQSFFFWTFSYLKDDVGIPGNWVQPAMSISQVAEILTMIFLGYVLKRLGWRTTMIIGILGHAARFAVFAYFPYPACAVSINILHGICYAFFFATVYIFVDEFFPKDARASAQGLFNFLILGLGPFVANFACSKLRSIFFMEVTDLGTGNKETVSDYKTVYLFSCSAAVVAAVLLLLFFHPPAKKDATLAH
jgi:Nucleoside H+ symporter